MAETIFQYYDDTFLKRLVLSLPLEIGKISVQLKPSVLEILFNAGLDLFSPKQEVDSAIERAIMPFWILEYDFCGYYPKIAYVGPLKERALELNRDDPIHFIGDKMWFNVSLKNADNPLHIRMVRRAVEKYTSRGYRVSKVSASAYPRTKGSGYYPYEEDEAYIHAENKKVEVYGERPEVFTELIGRIL